MARPTKLNKTIQNQLLKLIRTGVSIEDACSHSGIAESTFYDWQKRGEDGEDGFAEFSEAILRARNAAKVAAIDTLHASTSSMRTVKRVKDTLTETRFNPYGKPFEYKRTDEHELIVDTPGDWRAAIEFLKRRYPREWSEKLQIEINVNIELIAQTVQALEDAGIDATEFFEQARVKAEARRDGLRSGTVGGNGSESPGANRGGG